MGQAGPSREHFESERKGVRRAWLCCRAWKEPERHPPPSEPSELVYVLRPSGKRCVDPMAHNGCRSWPQRAARFLPLHAI